jgi:hypothetical protein
MDRDIMIFRGGMGSKEENRRRSELIYMFPASIIDNLVCSSKELRTLLIRW